MSNGDFAEVTVVEGREDVARHFGKHERTVYRWEEDGMPVLPDGRYDLVQIALWRDKNKGKKTGSKAKPSGQAGEQERLTRARAERVELENEVRRGELIKLAELESLLTPRAMIYRQGMVALEQTLPPRLAAALELPPENLRVMTAVIREVAREVLGKVLHPLTLSSGQAVEWEKQC